MLDIWNSEVHLHIGVCSVNSCLDANAVDRLNFVTSKSSNFVYLWS
jgi:hypothetical protein